MLEAWGLWSKPGLPRGFGRGSEAAGINYTDEEMGLVDSALAKVLKSTTPRPARVCVTKYRNPELGENGESVPRSDLVVAAMMRMTQTDVHNSIVTMIKIIEG